jgi:hypothetical protein
LKYKDQNGEWIITALTMLANMWVSTSAANNWQFNPVKWDWKSVKTWSSLVQSGIAGYNMGARLENKIKSWQISKGYYLAIKDSKQGKITTNADGSLPKDFDFVGFQQHYFRNFRFADRVYMYADPELVTNINPDAGAFTYSIPSNGIYTIVFGGQALNSVGDLYMDMGHEFIHVSHLITFGNKFNVAMSEYASYMWNASFLKSSGSNLAMYYSNQAHKYYNFDMSHGSLRTRIWDYIINEKDNYGLPFYPTTGL